MGPRRWLRGRYKATRATARAKWRAWRVAARNRAQSSNCFYCGIAFSDETASSQRTVDHRLARSRGGSEALTNLVFACYACNQRKRDLPEEDFVASEWLARRRSVIADGTDLLRMPGDDLG